MASDRWYCTRCAAMFTSGAPTWDARYVLLPAHNDCARGVPAIQDEAQARTWAANAAAKAAKAARRG